MNKTSLILKLVSGIFAITASQSIQAQVMPYADLENFRIDCRIKQQQIVFLQSMRSNADQRLQAGVENFFMPWRIITDPGGRRDATNVHNGYTNWLINQNLLKLSHECM